MIKTTKGLTLKGCLLASAMLMISAESAVAQERDGAAQAPRGPAQTSSTSVQESYAAGEQDIVVTAQRRTQTSIDVPISITAMQGEQLESRGIERLSDLNLISPAVRIDRTGINNQPAIRGITTLVSGVGFENNVAVYVDGIYQPSSRGLDMDFVNIRDVQILKGPQGTLFGRNATGGAIMIRTLDPSLTETSGRINASYLRFDDRRIQAYFSTPITDMLAWNIAGSYRRSDGYIKDIDGFNTAPIKNYSVTSKLLFVPADGVEINLYFNKFRNTDGRYLAITFEGRSSVVSQFPGTYLETRDNRTSLSRQSINTIRQTTFGGTGKFDLGFATLTSVTSYQRARTRAQFDLDGTKRALFDQDLRTTDKSFQEDINLASNGDGPVSYVVGFYYFDWKSTLNPINALTNTVINNTLGRTKSVAGYADLTWEALPGLFLTAGLRYGDETKKLLQYSGTGALVNTLPAQQAASFNSWTPRAVIRYEIGTDSNVYASYSKGFKSGSISATSPFNFVAPEEVSAYELGYKTKRGSVRLDVAGYYYDYTNLQVSSINVVNGASTVVTTNAATAEVYGVEAQLSARISRDFDVNAGIAYTHARYTHFPNANANGLNAAGLNITSCPNSAPPPATLPCTQDWSGRQIARSPDWMANIGGSYTLPTGIGEFRLSGNLAYTSSFIPVKGDLLNGEYRYAQKAYATVNVRLQWRPLAQENLTLAVFGNNVTNARYYFYRIGNSFGDYHVLGQPATWGLQADVRF